MSVRVLVTGGAGFIGSNLCIRLQSLGHEVVAVGDLSHSDKSNLKGFEGEFVQADTRKVVWNKLGRFDLIFHQAAITDTTVKDKALMFSVNAKAFRSLLQHAAKTGAKVVYASSAAVYGRGPCPMSESQPPQPLNFYAESKVEMEKVAAELSSKLGVVAIGLRYFNVYGPGEAFKGASASMVWQLYQQMVAGKRPRIFKWGEQARDQIYVEDVVRANLLAAKLEQSTVVNVGTGRPTTFNAIVAALNRTLGTSLEPDYFDNPYAFYQNLTQADTAKAGRLLKFVAEFDIDKGVEHYLKTSG